MTQLLCQPFLNGRRADIAGGLSGGLQIDARNSDHSR